MAIADRVARDAPVEEGGRAAGGRRESAPEPARSETISGFVPAHQCHHLIVREDREWEREVIELIETSVGPIEALEIDRKAACVRLIQPRRAHYGLMRRC